MLKNISREKRIQNKIQYITEYVDMLHGRQKVDAAMILAQKISVTPNRKKLEKFLDDFIDGKGYIIIDLHNVDKLTPHCVVKMELVPDKNGNPIMILVDKTHLGLRFYEFPLCDGVGIHTCNEFLRSIDEDMQLDICFQTYRQYGQLILECFDLLTQKQEATA